jgi:hypothetical protein
MEVGHLNSSRDYLTKKNRFQQKSSWQQDKKNFVFCTVSLLKRPSSQTLKAESQKFEI